MRAGKEAVREVRLHPLRAVRGLPARPEQHVHDKRALKLRAALERRRIPYVMVWLPAPSSAALVIAQSV